MRLAKFFEQIIEKEHVQHRNIERVLEEQKADLFINGTFGTLPGFAGRKNWHIVHFPQKPGEDPVFHAHIQTYLNSYDHFLCNSRFTAAWFKTYYGKEAEVLYPPVNEKTEEESVLENKENMILTCGRIAPMKNCWSWSMSSPGSLHRESMTIAL